MRGEECQIVGTVASGIREGSFVMPGTHGKRVDVTQTPATNIGRDDLADRRETALDIAGLTSRRAAPEIVARGQFTIAKAAG